MVGRVLAVVAAPLLAGLIVLCACRTGTGFPPRLEAGGVFDTTQVIKALPSSGAVQISKNGYREFDLDAIVTDEDDADSTIRWSLSSGSLLNMNLNGSLAEIGPAPNQIGESYVVFTATDPGGLSATRICAIQIFDEFRTDSLPDSIAVSQGDSKTIPLICQYRSSLRSMLAWGDLSYDSTYLDSCVLEGTPCSGTLRVKGRDKTGTTAIQFGVRDPVNHVTFDYSTLVDIE